MVPSEILLFHSSSESPLMFMGGSVSVRVPIFPIVVCVRSAYVIGAGVGFRVESGAVALLPLDF